MLEFIAFVSYLLMPSELDPRVNLTLTVFLGIIFFQVRGSLSYCTPQRYKV